jgi:hypothetical protein
MRHVLSHWRCRVTPIHSALAAVRAGEPSVHGTLGVVPLIADDGAPPPWVTLDQALARGGLRVTEVSDSAAVSELKVVNALEVPVLLLDGEEVVGARQNRVFNLTLLIPAGAELLIPVSCVEAGRWRHISPEFRPAPRAQYAAGRSERVGQVSESLARAASRASDQSRVWENIEGKRRRLDVESPTRAMSDIYERFEASIGEHVRAFPAVPGQVGAVFTLAGEVAGMDLFGAAATLEALLPKLIRSYALDAIEAPPGETPPEPAAVEAFLDQVRDADVAEFEAIGLGKDLRLHGERLVGAALVDGDRLVHLCAFRTAGRVRGDAGRAGMGHASLRRRSFEGPPPEHRQR